MRVGLIGLGERGRQMASLLGSQLVAVADWDDGTTPFLAPLRHFADWREMIAEVELDVVVVATSTAFRGEMAQRSLRAGRDVWVEGLPCQTAQGGKRLGNLALSEGRVLWSYEPLSLHPAVQYLGNLMRSGGLGRPLYVSGQRRGLGPRRGDVFWRWGAEDMAALLSLSEATVQSPQGMVEGEGQRDWVQAQFLLGEWKVAFEWNRLSPELRHRLWVVGTKRAALLDYLDVECPLRIVEWEHVFANPPSPEVELLETHSDLVPLWVPECVANPPREEAWKAFLARRGRTAGDRMGLRCLDAMETLESGLVSGQGREEPTVGSLELR